MNSHLKIYSFQMSVEYSRMDGFSHEARIEALQATKCKLEEDLEILKQEEIDAFV